MIKTGIKLVISAAKQANKTAWSRNLDKRFYSRNSAVLSRDSCEKEAALNSSFHFSASVLSGGWNTNC
jgi:hypothetical protein